MRYAKLAPADSFRITHEPHLVVLNEPLNLRPLAAPLSARSTRQLHTNGKKRAPSARCQPSVSPTRQSILTESAVHAPRYAHHTVTELTSVDSCRISAHILHTHVRSTCIAHVIRTQRALTASGRSKCLAKTICCKTPHFPIPYLKYGRSSRDRSIHTAVPCRDLQT
jgi:hypothetical protein